MKRFSPIYSLICFFLRSQSKDKIMAKNLKTSNELQEFKKH